jgi:hypothetical protein
MIFKHNFYRLPAGRQGRQAIRDFGWFLASLSLEISCPCGTKDNRNVVIKSEDLYDLMKVLNFTIDKRK